MTRIDDGLQDRLRSILDRADPVSLEQARLTTHGRPAPLWRTMRTGLALVVMLGGLVAAVTLAAESAGRHSSVSSSTSGILLVANDQGLREISATTGQVVATLVGQPPPSPEGRIPITGVTTSRRGAPIFVEAGGVIYQVGKHGNLTSVAAGSEPALSPDGTHLAYVVQTNSTSQYSNLVAVMNLSTHRLRDFRLPRLATAAPGTPSPSSASAPQVFGLSWAPNGQSLAVTVQQDPLFAIELLDTTRPTGPGNPRRLLSHSRAYSWQFGLYRGGSDSLGVVATCLHAAVCGPTGQLVLLSVDPRTGKTNLLGHFGSDVGPGMPMQADFDATGNDLYFIAGDITCEQCQGPVSQNLYRMQGNSVIELVPGVFPGDAPTALAWAVLPTS